MEVSIKRSTKGRLLIKNLARWCNGEAVISNRAGPLVKIYYWRGMSKIPEAGNCDVQGNNDSNHQFFLCQDLENFRNAKVLSSLTCPAGFSIKKSDLWGRSLISSSLVWWCKGKSRHL